MSKHLTAILVGLTLVAAIGYPNRSTADNDACWGDNSRQDITCIRITEPLLLSLRGANMAHVQKLMGANGRLMSGGKRPGFGDTLRFLSNYQRGMGIGSGSVNVTFSDDHAVIVSAQVDTDGKGEVKNYIWNAYEQPRSISDEFDLSTRDYNRSPFCSDLSPKNPCGRGSGSNEQERFDRELVLMKEQFGSTGAEVQKAIEIACSMGADAGKRPYQCDPMVDRNQVEDGVSANSGEDVQGKVLPFTVVRAIRSYGFKDGVVVAGISISVVGGGPGDWMATAVYVAERAIINDVTSAEVLVIVPNPWADFPPLLPKELAKVYFDPDRRIWNKEWGIFAADHAASVADIEYYRLGDKLLDPGLPDPVKAQEKADRTARSFVIKKYHLPSGWRSATDQIGYLGLQAMDHDRTDIHIAPPGMEIIAPLTHLRTCLTENINGAPLLQGCMPPRE